MASLLPVFCVNLWSCWPLFSWPLLTEEAMWLVRALAPRYGKWGFIEHFEPTALRPLGALYFTGLSSLFGPGAGAFHTLEYLVFIAWILSMFFLTQTLTRSRLLGASTALLMAFLPVRPAGGMVHQQTFSSWSTLFGTLCMLFSARGLLKGSWTSAGIALSCFSIALLWREDAVIFAPMVACLTMALRRMDPRVRDQSQIFWGLNGGILLLCGIYLWVRLGLLAGRVYDPAAGYVSMGNGSRIVLERYGYTLQFLGQGFLGWRAALEPLRNPGQGWVVVAAGIVLIFFAYRCLRAAEAFETSAWKKKCFPFLFLAIACGLLGLFPTYYFRSLPPGVTNHPYGWSSAADLYRVFPVYLGCVWILFSCAALAGPRVVKGVCLFLLSVFFLLDYGYFRHPELSPYFTYGREFRYDRLLLDRMKDWPGGYRIAMWDTMEPPMDFRSIPVRDIFLSQVRLLGYGRDKSWGVAYLGSRGGGSAFFKEWVLRRGKADVGIWHEGADPAGSRDIYAGGSLKAYFPDSGRTVELVRFDWRRRF